MKKGLIILLVVLSAIFFLGFKIYSKDISLSSNYGSVSLVSASPSPSPSPAGKYIDMDGGYDPFVPSFVKKYDQFGCMGAYTTVGDYCLGPDHVMEQSAFNGGTCAETYEIMLTNCAEICQEETFLPYGRCEFKTVETEDGSMTLGYCRCFDIG